MKSKKLDFEILTNMPWFMKETQSCGAQLSSNLLFCVHDNLHLMVNLNVYDGFLCI